MPVRIGFAEKALIESAMATKGRWNPDMRYEHLKRWHKIILTILVILHLPFPDKSVSALESSIATIPDIVLWAWERPEDLRFIDPHKVGVAFLARTIYFREGEIHVRPRLQPLNFPPGTSLIAVVRIETGSMKYSRMIKRRQKDIEHEIENLVGIRGVRAIQIDFDAKESERPFYRDLLQELRHRLPPSVALSITALASWCVYDDWISGLPVDEAVPMLFRMGIDNDRIVRYISRGNDFRSPLCKTSVGISLDERVLTYARLGRRVYLFNPARWSEQSYRSAIEWVRLKS